MKRVSFLGGHLDELVRYDWPLPDIGTHTIGFGICQQSGLIMQSETVTPKLMEKYYRSVATYVNPSSSGKPTEAKVKDLDRLVSLTKQGMKQVPKRVLQIGSSDGYTLHRFREAGSTTVLGVDPGEASVEFAKSQYNVDCLNCGIEEASINGEFDLCVLTHVLEHLYEPQRCLEKIQNYLNHKNGYILVEVPLWERPDIQPLGVLAFEHLNYFCESSLLQLLYVAGFEALHISKNYYINHYPVITVLARINSDLPDTQFYTNFSRNLDTAKSYLARENAFWANTNSILNEKIKPGSPTVIYGGGIHTSQVLAMTDLGKKYSVQEIIDSSPTKWNSYLGDYLIQSPERLVPLDSGSNIVISSLGWQEDIKNYVMSVRSDLNIITLH